VPGTRSFAPLILVILGVLFTIAYSLGLFDPPAAHLAALVPEDAVYAVVSSSVNDLRELYVGTYQVTDFDAARARYGEPVNVPGLDGFDYDRPVGSYYRAGDGIVRLVPVADLDAFESAHRHTRENINVKAPVRVAKQYVSVAETDAVATVGPDNRMILEACEFPLALVGRPRTPMELGQMLVELFVRERAPRAPQVVPLAAMLARMPERVASLAAGEMDRFRLAVLAHKPNDPAVRFDLLAELSSNSHFAAATEYAKGSEVADLMGVLPAGNKINTILAASVMLSGESWQALGLPMNVGPAAGMIGIVALKYRAGRHTIVFGLAPTNERAFERIAQTPLFGLDPAQAKTLKLDGPDLRMQRIDKAPAAFAAILATDARTPPQLYVGRARIGNAWYCALGAHAEEVLRAIVGCCAPSWTARPAHRRLSCAIWSPESTSGWFPPTRTRCSFAKGCSRPGSSRRRRPRRSSARSRSFRRLPSARRKPLR